MTTLTEHEKQVITKYDLLYEQRMTRVETSIEHIEVTFTEIRQTIRDIRTDIRWLNGIIVTVVILTVMAKAFHWI